MANKSKKGDESGARKDRRSPLSKIKLVAVIVLIAAIPAAFILGTVRGSEDKEPTITSAMLEEQLAAAQDLVSVEYHYTNMGKFENSKDFYGWTVPFTTKSFIISYDGVIKAGVDLSECQIGVNEEARTIHLTLPESEIISHEILEDSIQVFDETHNIFNQITIEDYASFAADQKTAMEEKAIDKGLLSSASEKARDAIDSLLSPLPGMDTYTLAIN